jgi:hypothetical protein
VVSQARFAQINQFAAQRAGVPVDRCLYGGGAAKEVSGAIAAGMSGALKPLSR